MNTWAIIGIAVLVVLMFMVRIARPALPPLVSDFEITRALKAGELWAANGKKQRDMYPFARALNSLVFTVLFLILNGVVSLYAGLVGAAFITIAVAIIVNRLSLTTWAVNRGEWLYVRISASVEWLYLRRKYLIFLPFVPAQPRDVRIGSEDELLRTIDKASFLETDRRALIRSALEFTGLTVADAMSGRRSMHPIDKGEVLGPLLLDELYRTGKAAFVVTDGSLDDIVGILKLEKLTSLDLKDTPTALKAMSPEVHYIDSDAPITEALAYLRSAKAPFLIVRDDGGKTVGLLTMDNILRCLFAD